MQKAVDDTEGRFFACSFAEASRILRHNAGADQYFSIWEGDDVCWCGVVEELLMQLGDGSASKDGRFNFLEPYKWRFGRPDRRTAGG